MNTVYKNMSDLQKTKKNTHIEKRLPPPQIHNHTVSGISGVQLLDRFVKLYRFISDCQGFLQGLPPPPPHPSPHQEALVEFTLLLPWIIT